MKAHHRSRVGARFLGRLGNYQLAAGSQSN